MNCNTDFASACDEYFLSRNWTLEKCPKCSATYYTKRGHDSCSSYDCEGGYSFLSIPAPKAFIGLDLCRQNLLAYFKSVGYEKATPLAVMRVQERTLFVSAAGQIFDPIIYGAPKEVRLPKAFVLQPVIRLQGIDLVGRVEGFSTSFLNVAVEQWDADYDQHFLAIDHWLNFFSTQGFYVGNLCFRRSFGKNDWGGKRVHSETLKINYGGLEIGIANFFSGIWQDANQSVTMSDIGFGLERFLWARNKTMSYFDVIGPLLHAIRGDRLVIDTVRTLALMAGSGVVPSHKDHGYKFRLLVKRIADPSQDIQLTELAEYYHAQWSSFSSLPKSSRHTVSLIKREIDRAVNLSLGKVLGVNVPRGQDSDTFLRSLLEHSLTDLAQLRSLLGGVKHE